MKVAEDEPQLREILDGVANQIDRTDAGVILLLVLFGTAYALYEGIELWWAFPPLMIVAIFGFEAARWYYFEYPRKRLHEKSKKLSEGKDVDPKRDTGPGLLSPVNFTILGILVIWWLVFNYLLVPTLGRYPSFYLFGGGVVCSIYGTLALLNKVGVLD